MALTHSPSQVVLVKNSFALAVTAASTGGAGVNAQGYTRAFCIFEAAPAGAATTCDCKLQESSDNATWSDVTGAAFAQVITSGASGAQINGPAAQVMDVDLSKRKQYLRLNFTGAGGAAAGVVNGEILLFNAWYRPVSQDNTPVVV